MHITPEAQLVIATILFFIYDSSQLLYANEAILAFDGKKWEVFSGNMGLSISERQLIAPCFLAFSRPIYKLNWNTEAINLNEPVDLLVNVNRFRLLSIFAYIAWILIFIILPSLLFLYKIEWALLLCAAAIYITCLCTGIIIVASKKELRLNNKQAWVLASEIILCPVYAPNVIRKITLAQDISCNLVSASVQLLDSESWNRLKIQLIELIDFEIDEQADTNLRKLKLINSKKMLLGVLK